MEELYMIFKFKLNKFGRTELELPKGSKMLSIGEQFGEIQVWIATTVTSETEIRVFYTAVTGDLIRNLDGFMGTVILSGGHYVAHVFDRGVECKG